ncbi:MAG: hypothetical protein EBR01_12985 [Proteobacteria bacterium]|nr:hypothetical protein [Pseudomonadota bacterium]
MNQALGAFLLIVFLFSSHCIANVHQAKVKRCGDVLKTLGLASVKSAFFISGVTLGLTGGSEMAGYVNGTPHIGLSIYFDFEEILSHLDPSDRAVLTSSQKSPHAVTSILVRALSQKQGDSLTPFPYLKPIMASSYFDDSDQPSNMCRHKAIIMKAILRHLGIESNLMTGTIDGDGVRGEHVWLFIPSINQMADPMNNMVLSPEDYESRFHPKNYSGVMRWAKPLGIIGR